MQIERPLFWSQGALLQPQHFQLLERTCQGLLAPYQKYLTPHFWGVASMMLQKNALGVRSFKLLEGEFFFPDGTFVSLAENGCIEARTFDEAWVAGGKPCTVYLGLRKWRDNGENVTTIATLDSVAAACTRFVTTSAPEKVQDLHAGGPESQVKRLNFALKLFWDDELDRLGEYDLIPLAQLERFGAEIRLSDQFIPPCLCCSATPALQRLISEIRDQVSARCRQLEELKSKRGIHGAEFGSRDVVYLLALRSVSRYLPLLFHFTEAGDIHPWHVYGLLRQLIGELSTFSEQASFLGEREKALPLYDHENLWGCFSATQSLISELLDEITAGPEYVIALSFDGTSYAADLKPAIFEGRNRFYLAVTTKEEPKSVVSALEEIAKLSSREHLDLLITRSLPGIGLQHLQIPPQELPRRAGTAYFALDQRDDQWVRVAKENCLALYWNSAPSDLAIELMVVGR